MSENGESYDQVPMSMTVAIRLEQPQFDSVISELQSARAVGSEVAMLIITNVESVMSFFEEMDTEVEADKLPIDLLYLGPVYVLGYGKNAKV